MKPSKIKASGGGSWGNPKIRVTPNPKEVIRIIPRKPKSKGSKYA